MASDVTMFVLLGDIEVRTDDGQSVDIGHLRQSCVLASLLLDANRTVSADELVERVWADAPPRNARNALYVYLSRLRRVLLDVGYGTIVHQAGGYVLNVAADRVDVHRFRAIVDRARVADDEQAATLLKEALGLWRAEALAGADTPWFETQRATLTAEKFAAELDLADVQLRRGEHDRLLPELFARAAEHPLNERAAGQLVLALHRCGRTGDALKQFQHTRQLLVDELGIDPGAALQELHTRILAADRGLDLTAKAGRPVPRQLPVAPGVFTGRKDALAWLTAALCGPSPNRTVVVSAISGIGWHRQDLAGAALGLPAPGRIP